MEELSRTFAMAARYYESDIISVYRVGDIVRLKNGDAPQKVIEVRGHAIRCEYISSRKQIGFRDQKDYVKYVEPTNKEYIRCSEVTAKNKEETKMTTKLYKTISGDRYGEYKAHDGDKLVLLMKDSNGYEAFLASELKKVMPFTFDVIYEGHGKVYSFLGTEGTVEAGDVLMDNAMTVVRVTAVNTESESATKRFTGIKLVTEKLS